MKHWIVILFIAAVSVIPLGAYGVTAQKYQTRSNWSEFTSQSGNLSFFDEVLQTTYPRNGMWQKCPMLAILQEPVVGVIYYDDFEEWLTAQWVTTATGAGAVVQTNSGYLSLTNAAADDDSEEIQRYIANVNGLNWALAAGNPLWFEIKLEISDATQSDLWAGLSEVDTTLIDGPVDGCVGFKKDDGDANIDCTNAEATVATTTDSGVDIVAGTFIRLGFYYDGATAGSIYYYVDGALVATHTTNLPVEEMVVSIAVQNGEAVIKNMLVDYVKIVRLR